jgi:uncharacterized protein
MSLHAVIYRYAEEPDRLDEHRPRHKDYLASLYEQGRIVISGPLTDGAAGALLISSSSTPTMPITSLRSWISTPSGSSA